MRFALQEMVRDPQFGIFVANSLDKIRTQLAGFATDPQEALKSRMASGMVLAQLLLELFEDKRTEPAWQRARVLDTYHGLD